jgi:hypothetical protein
MELNNNSFVLRRGNPALFCQSQRPKVKDSNHLPKIFIFTGNQLYSLLFYFEFVCLLNIQWPNALAKKAPTGLFSVFIRSSLFSCCLYRLVHYCVRVTVKRCWGRLLFKSFLSGGGSAALKRNEGGEKRSRHKLMMFRCRWNACADARLHTHTQRERVRDRPHTDTHQILEEYYYSLD